MEIVWVRANPYPAKTLTGASAASCREAFGIHPATLSTPAESLTASIRKLCAFLHRFRACISTVLSGAGDAAGCGADSDFSSGLQVMAVCTRNARLRLQRCQEGAMLLLCPKCWNELNTSPAVCRNCGTELDLYSREYERRLIAALPRATAERRAQICWILGNRAKRSSVPALIDLLHDPDILVRVAALRALSEIGDDSSIPAVQQAERSESPAVRTIARQVLKVLNGVPARPHHGRVA
jgi:hypothetical protein